MIGDLARPINMAAALAGVDTVIHSAGLAPSMTGSPDEDFRRLEHRRDRQPGAGRAARRRPAVHLSVLAARAGGCIGARRPDRGSAAGPDRCLWAIQARGRTGIVAARSRLGRAASRAGVRAGRQGQHGAPDRSRPIALPASVRRAAREALAAVARQSGDGGGDRDRNGASRCAVRSSSRIPIR